MESKAILVVDDDIGVLESLSAILESEGYHVDTAGTAQEALKKSDIQPYELALINLKLPDMEGEELVSLLARKLPRMVKIILTGTSQERAKEAMSRGADGYLIKPIAPRKLLKFIQRKIGE